MYRIALAAMVIAGFLFSATTPVAANDGIIYGCYNKVTGSLRIVDAPYKCRHREVPIQWNQVGRQGPRGPQGERGPAGPSGPAGPAGAINVFDTNNQYLGILIHNDPPPVRYTPMAAELLETNRVGIFIPSLNVRAYIDQLTGDISKEVDLLFKSGDCAGTPFVYAPDVLHATSSGANRKYYVGEGSPQSFVVKSFLNHWHEHATCEEPTFTGTRKGFLATEVAQEVIPFTIPVSLPLRYEVAQ
jgi:hypothetical protein